MTKKTTQPAKARSLEGVSPSTAAQRAPALPATPRIRVDDGFANVATSGHPTGVARRRSASGTDVSFIRVAIGANTPLDRTINLTNDRGLVETISFAGDRDFDGSAPAVTLPDEMAAELDAAQGFSVIQLGPSQSMWEVERGADYDHSYSQPGLDALRGARRPPSAESDGESWLDELAIETIEGHRS